MPRGPHRPRLGPRPERRRSQRQGPFSGADVQRVLRHLGWNPEKPENPDEYKIYVHPQRDRKIPVNPDSKDIWVGDYIFECLEYDLKLSRSSLLALLDSSHT